MTVEGAVALVTGAASGMGRSCVDALLEVGAASVLAVDVRRPDHTDPRVVAVELDVTDEAGVVALVEGAAEPIQVAVNAAGVYAFRNGLSVTTADWNRALAVNLFAPFLMMRTLSVRLVREGRPGAFVNIASIAGKRAFPNQVDYCTAKAGLLGMTRAAALDLAGHGITVNAVCPGTVDTPMMDAVVADLTAITGLGDAEQRAAMVADIPIGRMQTAAEVAAAVAFLTTAPARAITGEALVVDGGLTRD